MAESNKKQEVTLESLHKMMQASEKRAAAAEKRAAAAEEQVTKMSKTVGEIQSSVQQKASSGKKPVVKASEFEDFTLVAKNAEGEEVGKQKYKIKPEYIKANKIYNPIAPPRQTAFMSIDKFVEEILEGDTSKVERIIELCTASETGFKHCAFHPVEK